jgi:hypothetical protein
MGGRYRQGYVTIATGAQRYMDMAVVLGLSLKTFDSKRPACLIHDDHVTLPPFVKRIFDETISITIDHRYSGCMNKIRLYEYSPFDHTMFVDADCVLMKSQIDSYWSGCAGKGFTLPGGARSTGYWEDLDIEATCKRFDCPYVAVMNSGTLYFERGRTAEQLFKEVDRLYCNHLDELRRLHRNQPGQYADEPFFGVAMGRLGLEPVGIDTRVGSWMVTTWRARRCRFDIDAGVCSLEKPSGFWWASQARFAKGWVRHSPVFVHFIGLKPRKPYRRLVQQLKTRHAQLLSRGSASDGEHLATTAPDPGRH